MLCCQNICKRGVGHWSLNFIFKGLKGPTVCCSLWARASPWRLMSHASFYRHTDTIIIQTDRSRVGTFIYFIWMNTSPWWYTSHYLSSLLLLMSLPLSTSLAPKVRAIGVKYYQVFLHGWIDRSLSVNSKIRKANGPSSRSRKAVICSWPPSPARTKSSRTHALIQLAGISAHPPLPLLARSGFWESGMLSLIISQSSGKPELYMDAEVERVRMTTIQRLWIHSCW